MEFFNRYKIIILRSIGAVMLVVGFAVHFWVTPQEGLSANQRAAANVARMEAKMAGSGSGKKTAKKDHSSFLKELKDTQEKQMQYFTIIAIILGIASLGYSFIPKKVDEA